MAENKTVRTRTEWTVEERTNSSFLILDALGGMKRGKVEIAKTSVAVLDGYDVVKWMVDFSNGKTEEFATREALQSRFNAEDISDLHPEAPYVDWKIDISSEASGVTRLWLHKELNEGTVDPEPAPTLPEDLLYGPPGFFYYRGGPVPSMRYIQASARDSKGKKVDGDRIYGNVLWEIAGGHEVQAALEARIAALEAAAK